MTKLEERRCCWMPRERPKKKQEGSIHQRAKLHVNRDSLLLRRQLTLIGVAACALVGLWTIVTLVQTLITSSHRNSVVGGKEPGLLLGPRVRLPNFGVHVVASFVSSVLISERELKKAHLEGLQRREQNWYPTR